MADGFKDQSDVFGWHFPSRIAQEDSTQGEIMRALLARQGTVDSVDEGVLEQMGVNLECVRQLNDRDMLLRIGCLPGKGECTSPKPRLEPGRHALRQRV